MTTFVGNPPVKSVDHPAYSSYRGMLNRCRLPTHTNFKHYGGRGIDVCPEWVGRGGFKTFVDWAEDNGYQPGLTIDRIDVNGDYTPKNCRFVDSQTQGNNRRNNRRLTYKNRTQTVAEWSRETGIPDHTIRGRIRLNWSVEDTLTATARHGQKLYRHKGSTPLRRMVKLQQVDRGLPDW